jgi:predicted ATPase
MLTRLAIRGFKSIRSTTIEPGAVNVFVGANGSGKSNVLEALGVLGAALFGSVEAEPLKYRGVRPGLPVLYKTSFRGKRLPRIIHLEASTSKATYRVGLDNPTWKPDVRWRVLSETLLEGDQPLLTRSPRGGNVFFREAKHWRNVKIRPAPAESAVKAALQQQAPGDGAASRGLFDLLTNFAIYAPTTMVLRGLATDVSREPVGLSGGNLPPAVRTVLLEAKSEAGHFGYEDILELTEWAENIAAVRAEDVPVSPAVNVGRIVLRFRDRFMAKDRNVLSAYDASEGALYVLFLIVLAAHPNAPRLLAVDNFDHALHPRLAANLMELVANGLTQDATRQVFLTTHNPLVLDGLDLRDDRVRLFAVERARGGETDDQGEPRAPGETIVRRVRLSQDLLVEVEKGMSLSRLWVMGRLGAMPGNL